MAWSAKSRLASGDKFLTILNNFCSSEEIDVEEEDLRGGFRLPVDDVADEAPPAASSRESVKELLRILMASIVPYCCSSDEDRRRDGEKRMRIL